MKVPHTSVVFFLGKLLQSIFVLCFSPTLSSSGQDSGKRIRLGLWRTLELEFSWLPKNNQKFCLSISLWLVRDVRPTLWNQHPPPAATAMATLKIGKRCKQTQPKKRRKENGARLNWAASPGSCHEAWEPGRATPVEKYPRRPCRLLAIHPPTWCYRVLNLKGFGHLGLAPTQTGCAYLSVFQTKVFEFHSQAQGRAQDFEFGYSRL